MSEQVTKENYESRIKMCCCHLKRPVFFFETALCAVKHIEVLGAVNEFVPRLYGYKGVDFKPTK